MKRHFTLILLFLMMYFNVFGQSNNPSPEPKPSPGIENTQDSTGVKVPENLKSQNQPGTSLQVVCLCCPSSTTKPPLLLIKMHNKIFVLDSLSMISPNWIEDIRVVKDSSSAQYGAKAKYGVIIITLNEKNYPEVYKGLKHKLRRFRPTSN